MDDMSHSKINESLRFHSSQQFDVFMTEHRGEMTAYQKRDTRLPNPQNIAPDRMSGTTQQKLDALGVELKRVNAELAASQVVTWSASLICAGSAP